MLQLKTQANIPIDFVEKKKWGTMGEIQIYKKIPNSKKRKMIWTYKSSSIRGRILLILKNLNINGGG